MKKLTDILRMDDPKVFLHICKEVEKHFGTKYSTDAENFIYAKGTSPICLVAHIDTMRCGRDEPVALALYNNVIRNVKGILGADDRAGVYGILEILDRCKSEGLDMPSVLFTNYEESGGIGVSEFIKTDLFEEEGINLFIELDRKGSNEFVYYSTTLPKKVKRYISSFGFIEENGSYSDISDLCDEYLIPGVNLSVGYYAQHSTNERLHVDELELTLCRVVSMIKSPLKKLYKLPEQFKYGKYGYYSDHDFYGMDDHPTFGATTPAKVITIHSVTPPLYTQEELEKRSNSLKKIVEYKDEIRMALGLDSALDSVLEVFFDDEDAVSICSVLAELEECFFNEISRGGSTSVGFNIAWTLTVGSEFDRVNNCLKRMAV